MFRGIGAVQVALGVSLATSLLCIFVPEFVRNLHASKLAEALDGLSDLSGSATMLAASVPPEIAFPESAPRTPRDVPAGRRVTDPPGTWQHPTWRTLGFRVEGPHCFSFAFDSGSSEASAYFLASAYGDLDGDGELSRLSVFGEVKGTEAPQVYPLRIEREVE
jgi:hypothetical protein